MVNIKNTLMTRTTALLLSIVMLISLIPAGVVSAQDPETAELGELSCITENGSLTNETGSEATATFADLTLSWSPADPVAGRSQDGWWVGVKMTAPADMLKIDDFTGVCYQRCTSAANDTWTAATSFWDAQDSDKNAESTERYLTMWGIVNEQYLNDAILNGTTINFAWRFDWNADGEYEQTAYLKVDPNNIKLLGKDGTQVYPATSGNGTVSVISEGLSVANNANGNIVKVNYASDTVLKWVEADPSVTRLNDGWWAGIKVTAPSDLKTETDFANVTYQNKANGTWHDAKDFWGKKDSDPNATEHFIGLWGLLNEEYLINDEDGNLQYIWRFDWNGDKVYEQIVVLEIDPAKITLIDANDVQVYPKFGAVNVITGGFVEGSGTDNVTVTASDLTLNWSDKNVDIGRNQAGWWAGIQITAPENVAITEADDVKYQSKVGDADWSAVKSFYKNQDSAKDGSVHYMQLWTMLDRAKLQAAVDAGENITTQWRFDWDKDGIYEQTVTFNIVPDAITLNRVDRADFAFTETATDKKVWIGDGSYIIEATSEAAPGNVEYKLDDDTVNKGVASIETKDGKGYITFNTEGVNIEDIERTVTVTAAIAQDDVYNSATATFTFQIVKKEVAGFAIDSPADITYSEGATFSNVAKDPTGNGDIRYEIIDGDAATIEDPESPVLKINKAGTVTVQALRLEDDKYYKAFAEYTLTIDKADQDEFRFTDETPNELTYSFADTYDTIKVEGEKVQGENVITYTVTGGNDVAQIVDGNKIKTLKSGKFTLDVTVAGDDCYNEKTISQEFTVVKNTRKTFAFEEDGPFTVVYNENGNRFVKKADTDTSDLGIDEKNEDIPVTYEIVSQLSLEDGDTSPDEKPVVEFDQDGVTLIINRSGKVTVKATMAEDDDKYLESSVTYELTVEKAEQSFDFANGTEINRYYGIKEYDLMANNPPEQKDDETKPDGIGHGNGDYTFELVENPDNIQNANIDKYGTAILFDDNTTQTGTITVKAIKAADDCYKSCSNSYNLKVEYYPTPDSAYSIEGQISENGWYKDRIEILPPPGYEIAFNNKLSLTDEEWKESEWYDEECYSDGENEDYKKHPIVYLRHIETGGITGAIDVVPCRIDKSAPTDLNVSYDITIWETISEKLFGFKSNSVEVILTAKDAVSGIDFIKYSTDGVNYTSPIYCNGKNEVNCSLYIDPQYKGKVVFEVTDMVGNTTEYIDEEDRTVIVDSISPLIDAKYTFTDNLYKESNDIYYTKGNVNVEFVITEEYFDLDAENVAGETVSYKPVVLVADESDEELTWIREEIAWTQIPETNNWKGSIDLEGEGDYWVKVDFTDIAGNKMQTFEQKIYIDKTAPVISDYTFAPGEVKGTNNGRDYYDAAQTVTLTVTEHNFDPAGVKLTVIAENKLRNISRDYSEYVKDPANWESEGDVHTLKTDGMVFDVEANYALKLTVTDYADNSTTDADELFTVDTVNNKPATPKITYSKSALAIVAEKITFGFFKAPINVTVESSDTISGLKYIKYSYVGTKGEYVSDKVEVSGSGTTDNTVKFTIPAGTEFKGVISATAYDWSLVESATQNVGYDYEGTKLGGIVLDNTAPTRVVTPSAADRVVSNKTLKDINNYAYSAENTNAILYYKDKATITFKVTEANFYKEDVHVFVNKVETNPTDWKLDENNNWVGTITINKEGDYVVEMTYTDKSGNEMPKYTSEKIVIDRTDPTISVSYADNKKYVHKIDGREYYDANRKATIKIKDHNFRADDVVVTVYAKNIVGENITPVGTLTFGKDGIVNEYLNDGRNREKWSAYKEGTWRRDNDTFELVLEYTEDANYTFDIAYTDLAKRVPKKDYKEEFFTVDKTKPECVNVAYSTSVFENILEDVTFGYYNAQMTVTVTAKDDISGVHHFVYSYLKGADVSSVNAQLIDEAIANAEITYDGKTATAEFKIPKLALNDDNQFNGIIEFTAYDRSENKSKKFTDESTVIVVDNIKPTSQVTLSDPVQKVKDVSYYDGNINATIVVNEANFHSQDVRVVVTKNGANYPVNVNWTDNSVDVHTGTFTLTEDGDYIVNVTYADRSKNEMTPYVSNQLTIDTNDPVISVSDVTHQSANNDETISFTVSVADTNIALESFKPTLNAVIKKDNGDNSFTYETMAIALGDATATTNEKGETVYSYTVSNLEVDGFYSLVCTAVDYANHSVSIINSATDNGGNTTVETMNFSVNREGSVFWIETEHNDKYTGETFVDKLNGAYANDQVVIKLHEINVDKVDEDADKKTVFTLNDGSESKGIVLKENENYSKNVIVGTGGWYETIYTLDNNTFDHDGVYSLNVITYDEADNSNVNTKTETGTISFTLDRTNPVISANVKTDQSVNDTQFWVEFEITETNLNAETIVVKLTNNDGETVETTVEDLGNNEYKFLVESGYNYSIEIVAKDLAGNESELYKVEHFTVSTNILILWYANTPLFWGSIGGTVLLAGAIILLVFLKKRKKNEER